MAALTLETVVPSSVVLPQLADANSAAKKDTYHWEPQQLQRVQSLCPLAGQWCQSANGIIKKALERHQPPLCHSCPGLRATHDQSGLGP